MSLRVLAVALVSALALAGCANDDDAKPVDDPSAPIAATPADPALATYYAQKLTWKKCRSGEECTKLTVPLDYGQPAGRTIQLSVIRAPAKKQDARVGSLVVNPGGPGGSGVDYAAQGRLSWGDAILDHFDVVGFDPRGVGSSEPLECVSGDQMDAMLAADPDPDTPAERATFDTLSKDFFAGCMAHDAELAAHMSTEEVARDLDILRAALGDERLSYFGASYGTYIGATYAGLFPTRVGRFVLDGAIDPAMDGIQMSLTQAQGFETALRSYVGACVKRSKCFLGSTVDDGVARIQQFIQSLDAHPIKGDGKRQVTEGLAIYGIITPLYSRDYWRLLDLALTSAFGGDGAALLTLADAYASRGPDGYTSNALQVLNVVNCLDHSDYVPADQIPEETAAFEAASPTFGRFFAAGLSTCGDWSVQTGKKADPIAAPGAAPILVLGTTRDPATPLDWAKALASQLGSGVLVTRDGDGHTAYNTGNKCIDGIVEGYLVSGDVPKPTSC